ncbi:MAG TPA: hypothetical protein VFA80_14270 [Xanthobacteraceae bacterium]|nr:hypothetical protein [Xanthobacteraceae bacterium]
MRSAGNFHPEWGYLAPRPSFVRTLRIALVATAIGATAGAAVVVSLVARPASRTADSSIAAHALVSGVPVVNAASAAVAPAPAQSAPVPAQAAAVAAPPAAIAGANPNNAAPPQIANAPDAAAGAAPAHTAHIEEPAAAPAHDETALVPEAAPGKKATKKHRVAGYETMRRWQSKKPRHNGSGFEPLFRLFSSRNGSMFSTN